jgi:hypothetical protein
MSIGSRALRPMCSTITRVAIHVSSDLYEDSGTDECAKVLPLLVLPRFCASLYGLVAKHYGVHQEVSEQISDALAGINHPTGDPEIFRYI